MIEDVKDMPVMDGAEATYPLYAAVAKTLYKYIDSIEMDYKKYGNGSYENGKIVIAAKYDWIGNFQDDGTASVEIGRKIYYINTSGAVVNGY